MSYIITFVAGVLIGVLAKIILDLMFDDEDEGDSYADYLQQQRGGR